MPTNKYSIAFLFFAVDRFLNIAVTKLGILSSWGIWQKLLGFLILVATSTLLSYFYVKKFNCPTPKRLKKFVINFYIIANGALIAFGLLWLVWQGLFGQLVSLLDFQSEVLVLLIVAVIVGVVWFLIYYSLVFSERYFLLRLNKSSDAESL